ncbi:MAG: aldo/keto reductase [Bacteroidota bacterium]|nr:aldo/keto reductase [Bacteroidota bacterium]MDP4234789.1 aldo/keto reductase [Bacteroidota bacterium]MDP4289433.1 aldo/keto reductase [Bacteroidota bacterium]
MHITANGQLEELQIAGHATAEATHTIPIRHPEWTDSYRSLGRTGLTVSGAGFGSYRVDHRVASHRAALAKAIRMGVNLIDTSSNYAGGNAERLIGEVLAGLVKQGLTKRDEMVVISKGSYIQGALFEEIQLRANAPHADYSAGSELSDLVRHSNGLWHSIHPDFLRDQITASLDRLALPAIDVYLLHNPEYFIEWAIAEGHPEDEVQEEYYQRIQKAFRHLESEVEQGRIQWYGISSNTFVKPEGTVNRTSLEACWRAAEDISPNHHFAIVQFPLNIFEHGAITERNQKRGTQTVMEFCREKNLGVLINRPLNAIVGKQLIRLADFPEREVPPEQDIDDLTHDLRLQEEEFFSVKFKGLTLNPQSSDAVQKLMTLGRNLDEGNWREFASVEEWQDISQTVLAPRLQYVFDILRPLSKDDEGLYSIMVQYAETADDVFEHISNYYSNRGHARAEKIHAALDSLLPAEDHALSLSQKSVLLVRSVPGVSSVLVGMRSEEYVDDVVFGLQAKPVPNAEAIWPRIAPAQAE